MYWLLARMLMPADATHDWLAWSAIVIPIAPIVYGATDLVMVIWRNLASTERRAAVVQMATEWEVPGLEQETARPQLPAVPPVPEGLVTMNESTLTEKPPWKHRKRITRTTALAACPGGSSS